MTLQVFLPLLMIVQINTCESGISLLLTMAILCLIILYFAFQVSELKKHDAQ